MNRELFNRLKTAGEYQRKAIHALFSDNVCRHLDVIEKELKMMAVEIASDAVREYRGCGAHSAGHNDQKKPDKKGSEVKKVDIV